jgi:hypothetical protein
MGINMTKVCSKCGTSKPINDFHKDKHKKDGLTCKCKQCFSKYFTNNKSNISEYVKEYQNKNKNELNEDYQNRYQNNKEYYKKYNTQPKNKKRANINTKKRREKNPIKKLHDSISASIIYSLKNISESKHQQTLKIIGLESWNEFREHIESQWIEGMNWANYGKTTNSWSIDHIIPKSSAKTKEEVYKLNHYKNLRPMWHIENIKKSNKCV